MQKHDLLQAISKQVLSLFMVCIERFVGFLGIFWEIEKILTNHILELKKNATNKTGKKRSDSFMQIFNFIFIKFLISKLH